MTTYNVEFPLRTISLDLQDKVQTVLEEDGLAAYHKLHKELWDLKQIWLQCHKGLDELRSIVKDLKASYLLMETETKKYGSVAGFSDEEVAHLLEPTGSYTIQISHLQKLIEDYKELIKYYNERKDCLDNLYTSGTEIEEHFEMAHFYFDRRYFSMMLSCYEFIQIDTVSLDKDYDQFREAICEVYDLQEKYLDEWNEMTPDLDALSNNIKELDKRFESISKAINATPPGEEKILMN